MSPTAVMMLQAALAKAEALAATLDKVAGELRRAEDVSYEGERVRSLWSRAHELAALLRDMDAQREIYESEARRRAVIASAAERRAAP